MRSDGLACLAEGSITSLTGYSFTRSPPRFVTLSTESACGQLADANWVAHRDVPSHAQPREMALRGKSRLAIF
jgi:hypothetical protein